MRHLSYLANVLIVGASTFLVATTTHQCYQEHNCWPWRVVTCRVQHTFYKEDVPQGCVVQPSCNNVTYTIFIPFLSPSEEYGYCLLPLPFTQWFFLAPDFPNAIKLPSQSLDVTVSNEFIFVMSILSLFIAVSPLLLSVLEMSIRSRK